ncbi:MAG: YcaO-like family protein [Pseudomonadota bacterium]
MIIQPLPTAPGLFVAAAVDDRNGTPISATGLGETEDKARLLCQAELIERMTLNAARSGAAVGGAAGRDRDMAIVHALWEAAEREAAWAWWLGEREPVPLSDDANGILYHLRECWQIGPRPVRLARLATPLHYPTIAAVTHSREGHDLCIGSATRATEDAAIRAAVKEMLQMAFGLELIRYRETHGRPPDPREQRHLDRATSLAIGDCAPLFRATRHHEPHSACPVELLAQPHLDWLGQCANVAQLTFDAACPGGWWVAQVTLPETHGNALSATDPPLWSRWPLY